MKFYYWTVMLAQGGKVIATEAGRVGNQVEGRDKIFKAVTRYFDA